MIAVYFNHLNGTRYPVAFLTDQHFVDVLIMELTRQNLDKSVWFTFDELKDSTQVRLQIRGDLWMVLRMYRTRDKGGREKDA